MTTNAVPKKLTSVTIRFAGDSGDGMQLTGDQFSDTSALMGNDIATFPDFPAEIRAPQGTLPGVSSFQIQFSEMPIFTSGDVVDVLVAMNPAALRVNLENIKRGGLIIVNEESFNEENLKKANWPRNPLDDETLKDFQVIRLPLITLTRKALEGHPIRPTDVDRCKNFFALGLSFWLYSRSADFTIQWIKKKFAQRPEIADANIAALKAGYNYADITEAIGFRYEVSRAPIEPGTYRKISGNQATAIGLVAASMLAKKTLLYASYPITPASEILHELSRYKNYGVKTIQAEDEIAACGGALGAAFGGEIGATGTSGPGMCLKAEMIGLAVAAELPLVIIDNQRGGPSTGMPTKTEQGDLLQALYGRNGESPIAAVAPKTPSDCFRMTLEAVRIAVKYMTPVVVLSDGYLAMSAEPWKIPDLKELPEIKISHPKASKEPFLPYVRDTETLARPWGIPGTPGLEHRIGGLSKADKTGNVSYDPENNQRMVNYRAEKIRRIARDIPPLEVRGPRSGRLLVLGWGSTYGAIYEAISRLERADGVKVSQAHLSYLNPFPQNLGEVLKGFDKILVPELNMGHLLMLLRYHFPGVHFVGFNQVKGQPFRVADLMGRIKEAGEGSGAGVKEETHASR